ncbi:hypothetical protein CDEF62S_01929 [Castellaniella defragrans]
MTRRQKLLDRFLKTPAPVDFRFDDLAVLLEGLGFSLHENARGYLTRCSYAGLRIAPSGVWYAVVRILAAS